VTEAEWLAGDDLHAMLRFTRATIADRTRIGVVRRKRELFLVACCERIEDLLVDARSRSALACARRAADGRADRADVEHENRGAEAAWIAAVRATGIRRYGSAEAFDRMAKMLSTGIGLIDELAASDAAVLAAQAVRNALGEGVVEHVIVGCNSAARARGLAAEDEAAQLRELGVQCMLLRDVFGNPFRSVAVDAAWLTSDVVALARGIYDERAFDRMPILADALQDAGCDNDDILTHCRGSGPHVRGCWVVDLLLGKE
jgi:hypothetical protein